MPSGIHKWTDDLFGDQSLKAKEFLGDFIVGRSYGVTAYQLAVVIDDHDFGINHVVRGNDLIFSTYRQNAIYKAMAWATPAWLHVPLVVGVDGRRLAKRHGDSRLSMYREQGVLPERIIGYLAESVALTRNVSPITAVELLKVIGQDQGWLERLTRNNVVFDPSKLKLH